MNNTPVQQSSSGAAVPATADPYSDLALLGIGGGSFIYSGERSLPRKDIVILHAPDKNAPPGIQPTQEKATVVDISWGTTNKGNDHPDFQIRCDDPRYEACEKVALDLKNKYHPESIDPKDTGKIAETEEKISREIVRVVHQQYGDYNPRIAHTHNYDTDPALHSDISRAWAYDPKDPEKRLANTGEFKKDDFICRHFASVTGHFIALAGVPDLIVSSPTSLQFEIDAPRPPKPLPPVKGHQTAEQIAERTKLQKQFVEQQTAYESEHALYERERVQYPVSAKALIPEANEDGHGFVFLRRSNVVVETTTDAGNCIVKNINGVTTPDFIAGKTVIGRLPDSYTTYGTGYADSCAPLLKERQQHVVTGKLDKLKPADSITITDIAHYDRELVKNEYARQKPARQKFETALKNWDVATIREGCNPQIPFDLMCTALDKAVNKQDAKTFKALVKNGAMDVYTQEQRNNFPFSMDYETNAKGEVTGATFGIHGEFQRTMVDTVFNGDPAAYFKVLVKKLSDPDPVKAGLAHASLGKALKLFDEYPQSTPPTKEEMTELLTKKTTDNKPLVHDYAVASVQKYIEEYAAKQSVRTARAMISPGLNGVKGGMDVDTNSLAPQSPVQKPMPQASPPQPAAGNPQNNSAPPLPQKPSSSASVGGR